MKKKMSLGQIGLYNPQRISDSDVEDLFVVRTKLFSFLIDKLKKEKTDSIPQHYLVIAQRGMGKTTMLKRIEVELRKPDLSQLFIPLLFPEEQYNMKNLAEFWLNSLDALADTLEVEKQHEEVAKIDIKVKELGKINNNEELANEAYKFLKSICVSMKRRPVLLIDNMNLIFDRLEKVEQHTLRAWLMQNGAPVLIGASAVAIEGTTDYGAPFYDAFQIHYLKRLSFGELKEVLINLANLTQSDDVIPQIEKETGRIKTLHQLTGGNPRTAVMLFRLIIKGFSKEINDDLEALLDEVTPLYKARFEELSTQMQVIVDAIALHWDPINLEQLREASHYENNQLSPQLKRLVELGWIEKLDAYKAKGGAYQISERFFNIWFLMRRSSRRQKKELYCLSKFLESFYGEELESIAEARLNCKATCVDHLAYNLALAEVVKNEPLAMRLKEKSYQEIRELAKVNPKLLTIFDLPQSNELSNEKFFEFLYNQIQNNPRDFERSISNEIKKFEKKDMRNNFIFYALLGIVQYKLGKYKEAEFNYERYLEECSNDGFVWNQLGIVYQMQNKFEDSEKAYLKSTKLDKYQFGAWNGLGNLYQDCFQKYNEAELAYKNAIMIDNNNVAPKINLIFLLRDKMNRVVEAEDIFNSVVINDDFEDSYWLNKSLFDLYKKNEGYAKDSFTKALDKIESTLPESTQDDWWRFGAVVVKLGYGNWLLAILEEKGYDIILSPYYVAIKAMTEKDADGYLNSKAVEIREPARKLIEIMQKY